LEFSDLLEWLNPLNDVSNFVSIKAPGKGELEFAGTIANLCMERKVDAYIEIKCTALITELR
jgi:hypothetical protein